MRLMLLLLAVPLLALAPPSGAEPVACDPDPDAYQHCNAGPAHVVVGPWCAGVEVGAPAACRPLP